MNRKAAIANRPRVGGAAQLSGAMRLAVDECPPRGGFMSINAVQSRGRSHLRRGFTLVEILAVVVILGIASAIIIPQIGSRDDMKAAAAARVLIADLIYAQNLAISSG